MEARRYALFMIPCIFAYSLLQCHIRFLQAQNNVLTMMIGAGIVTSLHIFFCWILVLKLGIGSKGAALAISATYWTWLIILACYVNFSSSCNKTWIGLSMEAFRDVLNFLKLAIPSAAMICLEIWAFELVVLLSGLLPNPNLETSVLAISYLYDSLSTRVSNELGAENPNATRFAVHVALFIVITDVTSHWKWYTVFRGWDPGVYGTWYECYKQGINFDGFHYAHFDTKEEAIAGFDRYNHAATIEREVHDQLTLEEGLAELGDPPTTATTANVD
ncbi:hypothetical protein Syun_003313 [Stephania yunnanensis]|uniref:Ribonuclease H1 N-terminal domain-containing protein n=1 Tax=Stephania yunnanensis TaxID=152371 RepID=A0AAP0L144_9MAGN